MPIRFTAAAQPLSTCRPIPRDFPARPIEIHFPFAVGIVSARSDDKIVPFPSRVLDVTPIQRPSE